MKPTLNSSLRAIVLAFSAVSIAQADYTGGQISNPAGSTPSYSGNIEVTYDNNSPDFVGAVQLLGAEGSDKTLTLEGNINISTGYSAKDNTTDIVRNNGVMVGNTQDPDDPTVEFPANNSEIILKTVNANDQININVYGQNADGVLCVNNVEGGGPASIVLDATASPSQSIVINQHNMGTGGSAIRAAGKGLVEVKGSIDMAINGTGAKGLWADGQKPDHVSSAYNITVDGQANITSTGDTSYGVRVAYGKILTEGALNIEMKGSGGAGILINKEGGYGHFLDTVNILCSGSGGNRGISLTEQGDALFQSDVTIDSRGLNSYGINANAATATFNGYTNVSSYKHGLHVANGGELTFNGKVNVNITNQTESEYSTAVYCNAGRILMSGADNISQVGSTNIAIAAYNGGYVGSVGNTFQEYKNLQGKIQAVGDGSIVELKLNGQSLFTGSVNYSGDGTQTINLALADSSQWVVDLDNVSRLTTLEVYAGSSITFTMLNETSFRNINAATIMLESGSILKLDADYEYFNTLLLTDAASLDIALFNADANITGTGTLVTRDNYILNFSRENGTYKITGVTDIQIPEPATATLGLLGLASLVFRRRRV